MKRLCSLIKPSYDYIDVDIDIIVSKPLLLNLLLYNPLSLSCRLPRTPSKHVPLETTLGRLSFSLEMSRTNVFELATRLLPRPIMST